MAEFAYNNAKNTSTGSTPFELNYGYYIRVLFKEDVDFYSRSCFANKLAEELKELMEICYHNLLNKWELLKRANNKGVKSCSYALGDKI